MKIERLYALDLIQLAKRNKQMYNRPEAVLVNFAELRQELAESMLLETLEANGFELVPLEKSVFKHLKFYRKNYKVIQKKSTRGE